jgi:DNA-binding NarL/FixJ family response regulator
MPTHSSILLVDSDTNFRRMVKALIRRHYPHIIVREARNQRDALRQVRCFPPGLILTEIDMSGHRSLDLPRRMRAMYPETVIAVLTSYDLPEYREAAFQAGAHHFVSKSLPSGPAILAIVEEELNASHPIPPHAKKGQDDAHRERKPVPGRCPDESLPDQKRSTENTDPGHRRPGASSKRSAL